MLADSRDPRSYASETKFLLDPATAQRVRDWARTHLECDPNGRGPFADEYRITSLYFDTQQLDTFHRRESFGRAKYRIRRYGDETTLFLERKLKANGYLHKRRAPVPFDTLDTLDSASLDNASPLARDTSSYWFQRRLSLRRLRPVCEVTYLRTARVAAPGDGPVRLTIDEAVCARPADGLRFAMAPGVAALDAECVLELKYARTAPVLVKQLLEEFALQPAAVSKYRRSVETLGLATAFHA